MRRVNRLSQEINMIVKENLPHLSTSFCTVNQLTLDTAHLNLLLVCAPASFIIMMTNAQTLKSNHSCH